MTLPSREKLSNMLLAVLASVIVGLLGHAFGYERGVSRVDLVTQRIDNVSERITLNEKELIEIRAAHRQLTGEVGRDRTDTNRQLEKIEKSLEAIYSELRRR